MSDDARTPDRASVDAVTTPDPDAGEPEAAAPGPRLAATADPADAADAADAADTADAEAVAASDAPTTSPSAPRDAATPPQPEAQPAAEPDSDDSAPGSTPTAAAAPDTATAGAATDQAEAEPVEPEAEPGEAERAPGDTPAVETVETVETGEAERVAPEGEPDAVSASAVPGDETEPEPEPRPEPVPTVEEQPVGIPGEQIEWQPVVTGEQITWQPVVTKDNERPWPAAEDLPSDDYDDEDEDEDRARRRRRSAAGAKPVPSAKTKQRRQVVVLSVLSGIVVLVAILGFVLSRGAAKKGSQAAPPSPSSSVPGTTVPASQLDTIHDTVTGFTVKVPKAWVSVKPPEADIRLVMQAGNNDGFSVRVIPIQTPATQDNIGNFKAVTDAIVFGDNTNQEIQESLVTLNGRLTYYYLYTFPSGEAQGVHAHYFVFEGHRMFALVFQAIPSDDFTKLAAVFDQVAESFTVQDEATLPPTTTIPPPPSTSTPPTSG